MKVFGYGTFITRRVYEKKKNVKPAFLNHYFRVFRPQDWFPYVLKDDNTYNVHCSGFWGLLFEVNKEELDALDYYESEGILYRRILEDFLDKHGNVIKAFLYYPTDDIILQKNLRSYVEFGDLWKKKLVDDFPDIMQEFPQLAFNGFKKEDPL